MSDIVQCPFCGGSAELKIKHHPSPNGVAQSCDEAVVQCNVCKSQGSPYRLPRREDFTLYTVLDFRNNPAIRARIEEEYEGHCEMIKSMAVGAWNTRGKKHYE